MGKGIKEHGEILAKSNVFTEKEEKSVLLCELKEIFYNLFVKRTREMKKLHNSIRFQNFTYLFKCPA